MKPELGNVAVSSSPATVSAEDTIKLMVTYTASADLAMEESKSGADDATYGIIQVELPDGWATTKENVAVTQSSSVKLQAAGTDRDYLTVDGTTIVVAVASLAKGKFVKVTVNELKVPDFSDEETGDVLYAQVMVYSDQVADGVAELTDTAEAHMPVKTQFKPKVAATTMSVSKITSGDDTQPTITVKRRYRGNISVTEGSVAAESMENLKVRYIATDDLATPDPTATADDDMDSTYGRIQITLPQGWGPADSEDIHLERQTNDRDATYLSVAKTSSVQREDLTEGSIEGSQSEGWTFYIDVNAMRRSQYVELTIHNLMIGPREVTGRADADNDLVQVMVYSDQYTDKDTRDTTTGLVSPTAHAPVTVKPKITAADGGSDMQPTVTVTPKVLGAVTVSPDAVTAGSDEKDFKITYTATNPLVKDSVIEVQLPDWNTDTLTAYQLADSPKPAADDKGSYVLVGGSTSRLAGTEIEVNDNVVRIILGDRGLSRSGTVVLEYKNVTVQRTLNTDGVLVKVFSSDSADRGDPQYPVKDQAKDIIKVNRAADGSGMVMFDFEGEDVKPSGKSNTAASVPAGLVKEDAKDLTVIYKPVGDMVGDSGAAEFEIRLPSGWKVGAVRASVPDSDVDVEGNTINVDLRDHFGEDDGHELEIVLESITVPNDHGDDLFVAKSRNSGSSFKPLDAKAFVGNTMADADTMAVKITPAAAYEGEEDVDFEITLTASGPMHDSDIKITMPEGISGLQTDPKRSGESNYVRKVSASVSGVEVRVEDSDDENILIKTGTLNKGGQIRVSLNNVDIDGVSTEADMGFRVFTRTRGTDADADADPGDDENLTDVEYALIEKDGLPNNDGGKIRTVAGSGTLAVDPLTVEQGSSNVDFVLTYIAGSDFKENTLKITAPHFVVTDLQTAAGDGQVTSPHTSKLAGDGLVADGSVITANKLTLRRGERFVVRVNNVDLRDLTGEEQWVTTLADVDITTAGGSDANPSMVVVGTMQADVAFEIVDDTGALISVPEYKAASMTSIRFRFTAENTVIQPGGTLRFTVPIGWTQPSIATTTNRATVSIFHVKDGVETFVAKVADKWALTARGRDVTLTIDPKGKLGRGDFVIIRYGTPDTKHPVHISASARGTAASDEDGLSIRGYFKVSATGFTERDAGRIWVDITNVKDGTGTATITPPSVRADSTDNLIRVAYTAIGTMDDGAVRLSIPEDWGAAQRDDAEKPNYIKVTVSGSGAKLANFEVLDNGRTVQANLTTFGLGDNVSFAYGGSSGANRGAVAQADLGEAVFLVESRGGSGGEFEAIVDNMDKAISPKIEVKSAKSGSGQVAVAITNNKSGAVVYDGSIAERRIFAGDDKTYLVFTYTAEQTIEEGELELIVPNGWTAPQRGDTNRPGNTYIEAGSALVGDVEYNGQSVTATIEMDRGDAIEIHYGWYDTEDGGAHAPQAAGTYEFRVEFDGVGVASQPSVIVHGGTASKLVVTAPSSVSADLGTAPVAITVEIQDDTNATAVVDSDLEVTLSSTNNVTGSFTDADGEAIVDNTVAILAGSTEATAYYSDTGAGTTATVIATAVGLSSGMASITVTSDIDTVDESSVSVSSAMAKAGDEVTVTARGTAGKTATFSVGAIVTTMTMIESSANSGSYSGSFPVVQEQHDGTHDVTVNIGDASATVANAVTIDTNAPIISGPSASPLTVGNGDMVTISATVTGATSVTADVSALDDTKTDVSLTMANGAYSASVTISEDNDALNGSKTITVTAMDAAGNSATASAMVTLDNKMSFTSTIPAGTSLFHVPLDVEGLDTVGDLKAALGNVSLAIVYDSAAGSWNSRSDGVMITADLGMILTTTAAVTHTFEGQAWGGGASTISLKAGSNLIGLPVNAPNVTNVSDIMTLFGTGVVASIVVSTDDGFAAVSAAGAASDGPVMGDAAYLVTATADATAAVIGTGWSHTATSAAPVALTGYSVDGQTPVLDVQGAVVDEITGLAREGFRVKVKNLSTKASLNKVTSVEMTEGYNMTFVDLKVGNAARIGDVLEISADSPNPLIGVQPVRHIVTADDVKNSRIQLENLIAYEIPAETELLRNYPNPFNPETWIPYHLSEDADVKLTIYDINGEVVRDIDVGHQIAAKYDTRSKAIYWDGRNRFGEQVASGIYFYHLDAGDFSGTRKMVILK